MARNESRRYNEAKFVRTKKVVTLAELALHLNCSRRTVQRRLADWQAIRSYNRNGRYYTLPDIPKFDAHGLWRYRGVFFSKFGSLPETFVELVAQSSAGLTASEAGELLGLRPSSFLWSLRDHQALRREKYMGRYVYLSSTPVRYQQQREQRWLMRGAAKQPTDCEAVAILIEKIKYPGLSHEELSRCLEKQKVLVDPQIIHDFFLRHNLAVKKRHVQSDTLSVELSTRPAQCDEHPLPVRQATDRGVPPPHDALC